MRIISRFALCVMAATMLSSCGDNISQVQQDSPNRTFKDYNGEANAIVGVGQPISVRQIQANATFNMRGKYDIEDVMNRMAGTYNVAVRWGSGVRKDKQKDILISDLTFDEARSYLEDVYKVQIIREGERRLLVLPSAQEKFVEMFNPGLNVSLGQAVRGLAEQCDYNLVVTENKEKLSKINVSTKLSNVTCYDAFDALLTPFGMSITEHGDYYSLTGLPQRQWTLSLYEPERTEKTAVKYTSDFEGEEGEGGTSASVGGETEIETSSDRKLWDDLKSDLDILINKTCEENRANMQFSAVSKENSLLPPPETAMPGSIARNSSAFAGGSNGNEVFDLETTCGYVQVNPTVGLVTMQAPRAVLQEADEIIRKTEDIASRRLFLEARVLAVSKSRGFNQGANLQLGDLVGEDAVGGGIFQPQPTNIAGGFQPVNKSVTSALAGLLNSPQGGGGNFVLQNKNLSAVVDLLEQYGTTYELMQPTMELMDRQRGTLIDGTNERFFIRNVETQTLDNGDVLRNLSAEERSQFVGLQFSAVAQIAEQGEPHTVHLQIPITSISKVVQLEQEFEGEAVVDNIPVATTRLIDQKVRINDNEIKVVGGLTRTVAVDRESGVPLFREIPSIGKLLNEESITFEEVEFVILLQVRRLY